MAPKRKFDPTSGLVFNETIVAAEPMGLQSDWTIVRQQPWAVHQKDGDEDQTRPASNKRVSRGSKHDIGPRKYSGRGAPSLTSMCVRATARHVKGKPFTDDFVSRLPSRFIAELWKHICHEGPSLQEWKVFSRRMLKNTRTRTMDTYRFRRCILEPTLPLPSYLRPVMSDSLEFLTSLSIYGTARHTFHELLALADMKNLATLRIVSTCCPEENRIPNMLLRLIEEWAALPDPFPALRLLRLWGGDLNVGACLEHLYKFPSLLVFEHSSHFWAQDEFDRPRFLGVAAHPGSCDVNVAHPSTKKGWIMVKRLQPTGQGHVGTMLLRHIVDLVRPSEYMNISGHLFDAFWAGEKHVILGDTFADMLGQPDNQGNVGQANNELKDQAKRSEPTVAHKENKQYLKVGKAHKDREPGDPSGERPIPRPTGHVESKGSFQSHTVMPADVADFWLLAFLDHATAEEQATAATPGASTTGKPQRRGAAISGGAIPLPSRPTVVLELGNVFKLRDRRRHCRFPNKLGHRRGTTIQDSSSECDDEDADGDDEPRGGRLAAAGTLPTRMARGHSTATTAMQVTTANHGTTDINATVEVSTRPEPLCRHTVAIRSPQVDFVGAKRERKLRARERADDRGEAWLPRRPLKKKARMAAAAAGTKGGFSALLGYEAGEGAAGMKMDKK